MKEKKRNSLVLSRSLFKDGGIEDEREPVQGCIRTEGRAGTGFSFMHVPPPFAITLTRETQPIPQFKHLDLEPKVRLYRTFSKCSKPSKTAFSFCPFRSDTWRLANPPARPHLENSLQGPSAAHGGQKVTAMATRITAHVEGGYHSKRSIFCTIL